MHIGFVREEDRGQFYLNGAPTDQYRVQLGYDPVGREGEGDGFLVTNFEINGPMISMADATNLYIGWDGTAGYGMEGKMSDVFVYSRALSDLEMKSLSEL